MKRDSVNANVHMKSDTPSSCMQLYAFWMTPPPSPLTPNQFRTYLTDCPFLNQKTYKDILTSYSLNYKHSKK